MQRPYREPPRCGGLDVRRAGPRLGRASGSRKSPPERLRELFSVRLRNSERACAVVAMLCVCARPERQSFAFVGGNGLVGSCGRDTSARPGAATHLLDHGPPQVAPALRHYLGRTGSRCGERRWRCCSEQNRNSNHTYPNSAFEQRPM